jgi:hypothetical protein
VEKEFFMKKYKVLTHGQKSRFFAVDSISYWGRGCLSNIPQEEFLKMKEEIDQR